MSMYDPIEAAEEMTLEEAKKRFKDWTPYEGAPTGFYDPVEVAEEYSTKPFNGLLEAKKELPLRGWEEEMARVSPEIFAAVRTIADFFPFAKYIVSPTVREEFLQMSQEEQTQALLWESFGAALWGTIGTLPAGSVLRKAGIKGGLLRDIFYLGKQPFRPPIWAAKKLLGKQPPKIVPVEDALRKVRGLASDVAFEEFSYSSAVRKALKKEGFKGKEREQLAEMLRKGRKEFTVEEVIADGRRKDFSKAWTKNVRRGVGKEGVLRWPTAKLDEGLVTRLSDNTLRTDYYAKQFEKGLKEIYGVQKKGELPKEIVERVFRVQAERVYPVLEKEVGQKAVGFGDVTLDQMANITADMLGRKARTQMMLSVGQEWMWPVLTTPARIVFGIGEKVLGTMGHIYAPIKEALGRSNRDYFYKILLWAKMLEQGKAYTSVTMKATGEFTVKRAKWFTGVVEKEAFSVIKQMDDLTGMAYRLKGVEREELLAQAAKLGSDASPEATVLIDTWKRYSDHLYSDFVKGQIPRAFRRAGLTELGQDMVDAMLSGSKGIRYEVDALFSTASTKNPTEKIAGMKKMLGKVRKKLEFEGDIHPYFEAEGKFVVKVDPVTQKETLELTGPLKKVLDNLEAELGYGGKQGIPPYFENYAARVRAKQDTMLEGWRDQLFKGRRAFFVHARKLEKGAGAPVDLGTMVEARTMAQARELYLYDTLGDVVDFTKNLPASWRDYVEHYISGVLGIPSELDYKVANLMTKWVGGVSRMAGKEGVWSAHRVLEGAHFLNNLAYLGGLGFKPFSVMRNLFQTLLLTPADLGGMRDLGHLAMGLRRAINNPADRKWLVDIGALSEFAPEIHMRPRALPFGKALGMQVIRLRNWGMYMFRWSDRTNRYITGCAARNKWEGALRKVGGKVDEGNVGDFVKRIKLRGRRADERVVIEDLIRRGKMAEGEAAYAKSVVADTQYLYGVAEAPLILRKYGALSRTGGIFQSWWMNYGALLEKWMRTGQSPRAKAERMFTAVFSAAVAGIIMEQMWSTKTAERTMGFGPFPREFNEFLLPPAWKPIYHGIMAVANIQAPEVTARHAKAVLESAWIFTPGGLQLKTTIRGVKEEGFEGFLKSIIRYNPAEEEEVGLGG